MIDSTRLFVFFPKNKRLELTNERKPPPTTTTTKPLFLFLFFFF